MREPGKPSQRPPARHSWLEYLSSGVLSLMLAIVVWVMAVYQQDPLRTDEFTDIPIKYANAGTNLVLVGNHDEQARVRVRAPKSLWPLSPDVIEATVDLRGLGVGIHNVDVKVRSLERLAIVVDRTPARVVVRLEESVQRSFAVQADIADPDSVPPGYATSEPKITPGAVTVSGPRSLVESVSRVVATVWLRGSKTAVDSQIVPVAVDARGEPVAGVDLTPRTLSVALGVEPLAEFRDVTVKADPKIVPAAGYWVSRIVVEPAAVTVQGKPEVIRNMPAVVSTVPIDITGVKETVTRRVALVLPPGVAVYSSDPSGGQTVLVRIEVTPSAGGKTVQPKVEVLGLRSGLVAEIAPTTVDVIVSGAIPELQTLQAGDVRVVVNLFQLGVGRHMVTPTVVLPEGSGLKVESIAPETVEVLITSSTGGTP